MMPVQKPWKSISLRSVDDTVYTIVHALTGAGMPCLSICDVGKGLDLAIFDSFLTHGALLCRCF